MIPHSAAPEQLVQKMANLPTQLEETDETLHTIPNYTHKDDDDCYRLMVEDMKPGAVRLTADGTITYCNRSFAEMVKTSREQVMGVPLHTFIAASSQSVWHELLHAWASS